MNENLNNKKSIDEEKEEQNKKAGPSLIDRSDGINEETNQNTVVRPPLPLDWTKVNQEIPPSHRIVHPWDILDAETLANDPSPDEVVLVGTHGQKITMMGSNLSEIYPDTLRVLILRSHLLTKMEGLTNFKALDTLELYDNSIESLLEEELPTSLRILDMSYNVTRDMTAVRSCPNLVELYLAQNKIKNISGIRELTQLRKLDLGANRIRVMDETELGGLVNLEELWIGKNKIERIQGLENLTKLRRLDIQSNRLTALENLETQQATLEELYLADNGLTDEGAEYLSSLAFPNLTTLDLSKNRFTSTSSLSSILPTLEDLWMSSNQITTFSSIQNLSLAVKLEVIYLEFNDISKEFEYRKKLKEIVGDSLQQIDATRIVSERIAGNGVFSIEERMREMQMKIFERAVQQQQIRQSKLNLK